MSKDNQPLLPLAKPKVRNLLRLRCFYCGESPLLRKGSWIDFAQGCSQCGYRYEREVGYFAGSTWMVNYTVVSLVGVIVGALCAFLTDLDGLGIATATSISLVVFGVLFFPFGNAIWMYIDHRFHPLREKDRLGSGR